MEDIYTWSNDMYPLVKKSFDERYKQRINYISEVAGIVSRKDTSYKLDSLGGYGLLSDYNGTLCRFVRHRRFYGGYNSEGTRTCNARFI
ncbi:MAG: hypothetical protein V8S82_03975 [Eubacteriales bacterium]